MCTRQGAKAGATSLTPTTSESPFTSSRTSPDFLQEGAPAAIPRATIANPLLQVGQQHAVAPYIQEKPQFYGRLLEDPARFLAQIEAYFQQAFIIPESRLAILNGCLRDSASTWWRKYSELLDDYEEFRTRFLRQYNGVHIQKELEAALFQNFQKENEPVEMYMLQKRRQWCRLNALRPIPEVEAVRAAIFGTQQEAQVYFYSRMPDNFRDAIAIALTLDEEHQQPQPQLPHIISHHQIPRQSSIYCPGKFLLHEIPPKYVPSMNDMGRAMVTMPSQTQVRCTDTIEPPNSMPSQEPQSPRQLLLTQQLPQPPQPLQLQPPQMMPTHQIPPESSTCGSGELHPRGTPPLDMGQAMPSVPSQTQVRCTDTIEPPNSMPSQEPRSPRQLLPTQQLSQPPQKLPPLRPSEGMNHTFPTQQQPPPEQLRAEETLPQ